MKETYVFIAVVSMVVLMLGALVGGFWNRHRSGKDGQSRAIGRRFIQFVGLAWLIGATVILSLTSRMDGQIILGAVAGYLFGMGGRRSKSGTSQSARRAKKSPSG